MDDEEVTSWTMAGRVIEEAMECAEPVFLEAVELLQDFSGKHRLVDAAFACLAMACWLLQQEKEPGDWVDLVRLLAKLAPEVREGWAGSSVVN